MNDSVKTAVVTGGHAFDVPRFHEMWRTMPEIDAYFQDIENFAADCGKVRTWYDVVLFYHFNMPAGVLDEENKSHRRIIQMIEQLGDTEQGIVVLHHAIVAHPRYSPWSDVVGIRDRANDYFTQQTIRVQIAEPDHAITRGLANWEMLEETYSMGEPGEDCTPLLVVDHPNSMKALAWTRRHKNARVCCLQPGHDDQAYANPNFRTVLSRGILWAAGRI